MTTSYTLQLNEIREQDDGAVSMHIQQFLLNREQFEMFRSVLVGAPVVEFIKDTSTDEMDAVTVPFMKGTVVYLQEGK